MSNIVEPQITETKSSMFGDIFKNSIPFIPLSMQKPFVDKPNLSQQIAQQQAQLEIARQQSLAQQQAVMVELGAYNNSLTDKVFGKKDGYGTERMMKLGAYIIVGAVVGRYVAKNMKKSTTLGMVLGGLAPLLAYQLSIEYDRKNMPKQEPRQKVAIEPTPMPIPNKPNASLFDNSKYPMECMMKYALQPKEAVMMPAEYWKKREEDWMKTNCK